MNDLDLCLEVESRSCQPLRCIQRSLSRKPLEIVAWFQRITNRKWPIGYQVWCEAVRSAILATAWLLSFFCCFWCAIMPLTGVINYVCNFLLLVFWNRASIYIGFWIYWALSILQYPIRKKDFIFFRGGPRPKKVTGGPGWLRYATAHRGQGCQAWTAVGLPPRYPE